MIESRNRAAAIIRRLAERTRNGTPLFESTRNAPRKLKSTTDEFLREWFAALATFEQAQASAMKLSKPARLARIRGATGRLEDEWRAVLRRGYERAFRLGYGSRGRPASRLTTRQITQLDSGFESLIKDQARWASQFAQQYASGALRAPRRMGVGPRSNLYANSLKSAYNAGAVAGGVKGEKIQWKLGACDHCPDCPLLAISGPYTRNTLPTYPGAGRTKCATNCCCHLVFLGGRTAEVDAPAGAIDAFIEPDVSAPTGMATPTAIDIAFLRDLELRRNFARRRVAELEDGPEKRTWTSNLSGLQRDMNEYRRDRGIRWAPRFSVGDAITKTDIALKDVDDIFLRGIDGYTVYRSELSLINKLIKASNRALMLAVRKLKLPKPAPAVPAASTIITIRTAAGAADPEDGLGDALKIEESNRNREARRGVLLERDATATPPPVEPMWTVNLVGTGLEATLENHLALLAELKRTGPYFLSAGPFDADWPMVVSVTGSWIRGDGGEVRRLLLNLKDSKDAKGFAAAPLVGAE